MILTKKRVTQMGEGENEIQMEPTKMILDKVVENLESLCYANGQGYNKNSMMTMTNQIRQMSIKMNFKALTSISILQFQTT